MKQIKVPLTPREWAEKRLEMLLKEFPNHGSLLVIDEILEKCGFELIESEIKPDEIPTDKVEAVKYFLNQLPDGYRERALAQVDKRRIKNMPLASDLSEALLCFSRWEETKEGDGFWYQVDNHYLFSKRYPTLPPLPNE